MIDLTPLEVRKKRGDFRKSMRGFDPAEVDSFLDIVADRMEALVKENLTLKERTARLSDQVKEQLARERAVQDALVTAQALRKDISGQAHREAELLKREAESEIERMVMDAENRVEELRAAVGEIDRRRLRLLRAFRQMLERELDAVDIEESRHPLESEPLELELFRGGADAHPNAAGVPHPTAAGVPHPTAAGVPEPAADMEPEAETRVAPPSEQRHAGKPEVDEGQPNTDAGEWEPPWKFSLGSLGRGAGPTPAPGTETSEDGG